jgi:hypothetical protein
MCQYACLPAPKTVSVLRWVRRHNSKVEASAVRNAVISSALRKPVGAPEGDMMVSDPFGVASPLKGWKVVEEEGAARVTTVFEGKG